jgi:hypothetical protein
MEKLATLAPGHLSERLREGLRGHHPLFDADQIREAFEAADRVVSKEDADDVGQALMSICRDPLPVARGVVEALAGPARLALIRLYFRLLDRAEQERGLQH